MTAKEQILRAEIRRLIYESLNEADDEMPITDDEQAQLEKEMGNALAALKSQASNAGQLKEARQQVREAEIKLNEALGAVAIIGAILAAPKIVELIAKGISKLNGLAELKVKESNRLKMIADNLINCGLEVKVGDDYLEIKGGFAMQENPVPISTAMDHRIAMSFSIMGLCLENGIILDDDEIIKTSFPEFEKILSRFL